MPDMPAARPYALLLRAVRRRRALAHQQQHDREHGHALVNALRARVTPEETFTFGAKFRTRMGSLANDRSLL